jgi:hypothetical protein
MPAPVINPQSSVPMLRVNTPYSFNLTLTATSDAATSWAAVDSLPSGLTINTTTGVISGTPLIAGVREVRITATNSSGTSTAVTVAFAVSPVPYAAQGTMEINWDLDTRQVWNPRVGNDARPLFGKYRDKNSISVGVYKVGLLQDLNLAGINVWLKEDETSRPFRISTGAFQKIGQGDNARYLVDLNWDNDKIKSMLSNAPKPVQFGVYIWAEIELVVLESPPGGGSATLRPVTSQTFVCQIQQDFTTV